MSLPSDEKRSHLFNFIVKFTIVNQRDICDPLISQICRTVYKGLKYISHTCSYGVPNSKLAQVSSSRVPGGPTETVDTSFSISDLTDLIRVKWNVEHSFTSSKL